MASCLGLYIESNVIKYAKVTKEREALKIESFGMKFYEKLGDAVKQIISETFSYKIPITVNLSEDMYNYFYMFSMLNKNDLRKAIETEFESYCYDKSVNKNAFEGRYALANTIDDKDKIKVIYVSANKAVITKNTQLTDDTKASNVTPIGTSIANVVSIKPKENILIVNMEEKTTITTIVNQKIYEVNKLEEGAGEILEKINIKENSFSKAYEICKNSTIYTMEGKELQDEENEYLDDIMPTLYKIVEQVKDYVTNTTIKFDKIYITGTMSAVNNIDLYFQEFFSTEKCEILKPYFVTENIKINIKDYIEVNSAIALALQGLGYGIKNMNFASPGLIGKLQELMKIEVGGSKNKKGTSKAASKVTSKINFKFSLDDLKRKLDATERWLLRAAGGILILTLIYSGFSIYINNALSDKLAEVQEVEEYTRQQIAQAQDEKRKIDTLASTYQGMSDNLRRINKEIEDDLKSKDIIPNLLIQLQSIIPAGVQVTKIEQLTNEPDSKKVKIVAQAQKYEQLGYFKAKMKEDNILRDVVSTEPTPNGTYLSIEIEGDLL